MYTTFSDVDVTPFLSSATPTQPTMLIKKKPTDYWLVFDGDLTLVTPPPLFPTIKGALVRVPLMAYAVSCDLSRLFPFAFELGVRAMALAPGNVDMLHIAIGHPAMEIEHNGEPGYRVFLGCAFRLVSPPRPQ